MQNSGAVVTGLSVGSHTVTFGAVSSWTTPASRLISVTANQTTSVTALYVAILQTGSLEATLNVAGAQWAVDGGSLQNSGAVVTGLSVGSHTVTFSAVSGWTTPASQTVSVLANQTTSIAGTYAAIPQTGSLEATLNVAGAQWAVDGGSLQNSGAVVTGLSVGSHTVTFSAVSGWATPAGQTVSIIANQTASIAGTYVAIPQTGSLEATLNVAGAQWAVDNGGSLPELAGRLQRDYPWDRTRSHSARQVVGPPQPARRFRSLPTRQLQSPEHMWPYSKLAPWRSRSMSPARNGQWTTEFYRTAAQPLPGCRWLRTRSHLLW